MPRHRHHHGHDGHDTEAGGLIRWPRRYDLVTGVALAGRGPRIRSHLADLLALRPGQRVLDVGSGTGTLAISLARRVQPGGQVTGIDAASEMVDAADAKARRRGAAAQFEVATAQALPFAADTFDAAVSTLVIHHLPPAERGTAIDELVRVVRPGGRIVLADFQPPTNRLTRALVQRGFGHAMSESDLGAVLDLARSAGLQELALDPSPVGWLGVVHGRTPSR